MPLRLARHVTAGQSAQFLVDEGEEVVEGGVVPSPPIEEQPGDLGGIGHGGSHATEGLMRWSRVPRRKMGVSTPSTASVLARIAAFTTDFGPPRRPMPPLRLPI